MLDSTHNQALSAADRITGDAALQGGDKLLQDPAAVKNNMVSISDTTAQPPPALNDITWKMAIAVFQKHIRTYADAETVVGNILRNTAIITETRFGTIAAIYRYAVLENGLSHDSDIAGRHTTFGQLLFRCAAAYTDINAEDVYKEKGAQSGLLFSKFYNAVLFAAADPESSYINEVIPFILQKEIVTNLPGTATKNRLWYPETKSTYETLTAGAAWLVAWDEGSEPAKPPIPWGGFIEHVGASLMLFPAATSGDREGLVKTIQKKTDEARKENSFRPLAELIDDVSKNIQAYADSFGPVVGQLVENKVNDLKYKVYFFKGLLAGVFEACVAKQTWDLLASAVQVVIGGMIFSPASGTAFIAGTIYQIGYDIYSLFELIYKICINLGAIKQQVKSIFDSILSAINVFLKLDYAAMLEKLPEAMKAAGEALAKLMPENPEESLLDMIEGFGHFIGASVITGTLNFFLEDAKGFDIINNTLWNNACIAGKYFFNWGCFIGPLILEIILTLTTGVGVLELIGKNGAKLMAKLTPRLFDAVKDVAAEVVKFIVRIAGELKDLFVDNMPMILKLINNKIDVPAEKIITTFRWLSEFCEPVDLVEFTLCIIDAVFLTDDSDSDNIKTLQPAE